MDKYDVNKIGKMIEKTKNINKNITRNYIKEEQPLRS